MSNKKIVLILLTIFMLIINCANSALANDFNKSIVLVVDEDIIEGIQSSLDQFKSDLVHENYQVIIHTIKNSNPEELRSYLYNIYQNTDPKLVGAILIGEIPKPFFRYYYPEEDSLIERNSDPFISFQYYQDLDGNFSCSEPNLCNVDNCYDTHTGKTNNEIWVSVLPEILDNTNTILSINSYLYKNHKFRMNFNRPEKGYVAPILGSPFNTYDKYNHQVDIIKNEYWTPLTHLFENFIKNYKIYATVPIR